MSLPPVPPRPYDSYPAAPPPVPPLPPNFTINDGYSAPHFEDPLVAPRPHRVDPSVPVNMANSLDEQVYTQQPQQRGRSPAPPSQQYSVNYAPGFVTAPRSLSPLPPPQGAGWSPWLTQAAPTGPPMAGSPSYEAGLFQGVGGMSLSPQSRPRDPSRNSNAPHRAPSTAPHLNSTPSLTASIPTIPSLLSALPTVQQPAHDPALKVAWCRDVIMLVDRSQGPSDGGDDKKGPIQIADPQLEKLANVAVPMIVSIASVAGTPVPPHVAEAIYLRATLTASGAFPQFIQPSPRNAFRDYETAARAGYSQAWFKLGRDYENFNDQSHAKDCFERGSRADVESCLYRMGMAHLLGQLGLPANPNIALPLLHRAATLSSLTTPQPAYVLALILLGEFTASTPINIPPHLLSSPPITPANSTPALEARKHLERSAYLHFSPAQYKLGHCYEFASPPFEFDPLLSVEWYSKASQQGEDEADMALSKWFLCGAEGAFEKDEGLAVVFAQKAAAKGLPSAEFAMGYYCEVGIGRGGRDVTGAMSWYTKASQHGNTDATERLKALRAGESGAIGRNEHDAITENKLVRKRTLAKAEYDARPSNERMPTVQEGRPAKRKDVIENIRKSTLQPMAEYPKPQQAPNPQGQEIPKPARDSNATRPYANAPRYALTDPGTTGTTPPGSRPPSTRPGTSSNAHSTPAPTSKPGPQTFAEMGFQGAKAEDKECVVM